MSDPSQPNEPPLSEADRRADTDTANDEPSIQQAAPVESDGPSVDDLEKLLNDTLDGSDEAYSFEPYERTDPASTPQPEESTPAELSAEANPGSESETAAEASPAEDDILDGSDLDLLDDETPDDSPNASDSDSPTTATENNQAQTGQNGDDDPEQALAEIFDRSGGSKEEILDGSDLDELDDLDILDDDLDTLDSDTLNAPEDDLLEMPDNDRSASNEDFVDISEPAAQKAAAGESIPSSPQEPVKASSPPPESEPEKVVAEPDDHLQPEPQKSNATVKKSSEETMSGSNKAKKLGESIGISIGLVAMLVGAIGIWLAVDASQTVSGLKNLPQATNKQLSEMQENQNGRMRSLEIEVDQLKQQVNDLTRILADYSGGRLPESLRPKEKKEPEKPAAKITPKPVTPAVKLKKATPEPTAVRQKKQPVARKKPQAPAVSKTETLSPSGLQTSANKKGWMVNLDSMETAAQAEAEVRRLRAREIRAEYVRVIVKGKVWYRIRISGFPNEQETVAYQKYLKEFHGMDSWKHKE